MINIPSASAQIKTLFIALCMTLSVTSCADKPKPTAVSDIVKLKVYAINPGDRKTHKEQFHQYAVAKKRLR
jgi:hypothetical protein